MSTYWFEVVHPVDNVLKHEVEHNIFPDDNAARQHFFGLVRRYQVGGYYYLCSWGRGQIGDRIAYPDDWGGV